MVLTAAVNPSSGYREDIQGLRAIGALLVAVFHIWLDGISGGVDVFFVVSGYFLAQSYLREYPRKREFWAREHYARFLTRVAPPALITLVLVLILGFFLIWPIVVRNGLLMYMDATHLTRTYSGTLGDVLWERAMQPEQSRTSS